MSGTVVWITGLPSSGKSALAERTWKELVRAKCPCVLLDGDAVRAAIRPSPGYTEEAREAFYETLGNLAAMLAHQGLVVLVPATSHRRVHRERARRACPRFIEVHVKTPADACEERDAKGLYRQVREGKISGLPGVDVAYEEPEAPDLVALGGYDEDALRRIVKACGL
jgi:adenylylsulfate kinase